MLRLAVVALVLTGAALASDVYVAPLKSTEADGAQYETILLTDGDDAQRDAVEEVFRRFQNAEQGEEAGSDEAVWTRVVRAAEARAAQGEELPRFSLAAISSLVGGGEAEQSQNAQSAEEVKKSILAGVATPRHLPQGQMAEIQTDEALPEDQPLILISRAEPLLATADPQPALAQEAEAHPLFTGTSLADLEHVALQEAMRVVRASEARAERALGWMQRRAGEVGEEGRYRWRRFGADFEQPWGRHGFSEGRAGGFSHAHAGRPCLGSWLRQHGLGGWFGLGGAVEEADVHADAAEPSEPSFVGRARHHGEKKRHKDDEEKRHKNDEEKRHKSGEEKRHKNDEEKRHKNDEEKRHKNDEEKRHKNDEEKRHHHGHGKRHNHKHRADAAASQTVASQALPQDLPATRPQLDGPFFGAQVEPQALPAGGEEPARRHHHWRGRRHHWGPLSAARRFLCRAWARLTGRCHRHRGAPGEGETLENGLPRQAGVARRRGEEGRVWSHDEAGADHRAWQAEKQGADQPWRHERHAHPWRNHHRRRHSALRAAARDPVVAGVALGVLCVALALFFRLARRCARRRAACRAASRERGDAAQERERLLRKVEDAAAYVEEEPRAQYKTVVYPAP